MRVYLLNLETVKESIRIISTAYRTCKMAGSPFEFYKQSNDETNLIRQCIQRGHMSPLEHVSLTFSVEGVSRVLTHQLVRHRIASYSQQSQRYTKKKPEVVIPKTMLVWMKIHNGLLDDILNVYERMLEDGVPQEDARYILPEGTTSNIIVTMNLRQLLHFFNERLCSKAQWEIRDLAFRMALIIENEFPFLTGFIGAKCLNSDKCLEGEDSFCSSHYIWIKEKEDAPAKSPAD